MLIAVAGSSGLGHIVGIASTHPTALLEVLPQHPPSHILFLAPWYVETQAREQAHVVIAAHPQARIYVLGARHHALTLTLLGAVLSEYEGGVGGWSDPGEAVQLLQEAAAHSRSLVWHPRVLGLEEPQPTTAQRLSSLVRGPGFFSEVGVPSSLVPGRDGVVLRRHETLCLPGPVPALLQSQLGTSPSSLVDIEATMDRPYATRGTIELTGLMRPTRSPIASRPCPGCGASLMAQGCAFCGVGPRLGSNDTRSSHVPGATRHTEVWGGRAA